MPRFFFDIYDDIVVLDEDGIELPNEGAAYAEALSGARELMCEQVREGRLNLGHRIEVMDADRRPVITLSFAEAVRIER